MNYYLEDFPTLSLQELLIELDICEGLEESYEFRYPPIFEVQGWEESDEVCELREYIETLKDEITEARYDRELKKAV